MGERPPAEGRGFRAGAAGARRGVRRELGRGFADGPRRRDAPASATRRARGWTWGCSRCSRARLARRTGSSAPSTTTQAAAERKEPAKPAPSVEALAAVPARQRPALEVGTAERPAAGGRHRDHPARLLRRHRQGQPPGHRRLRRADGLPRRADEPDLGEAGPADASRGTTAVTLAEAVERVEGRRPRDPDRRPPGRVPRGPKAGKRQAPKSARSGRPCRGPRSGRSPKSTGRRSRSNEPLEYEHVGRRHRPVRGGEPVAATW